MVVVTCDEEGKQFVASFKDHPYIPDLARNPLMLSAICLVNYFEGGRLPDDRAMLYKLCVEGLLHHWDQRRGIHSAYSLQEKIRVCRETAIAMQADDKAEYAYDDVLAVFTATLNNETRAKVLLEHIRYRTGLLLERRPGVFAFAHLTFQEYLAALAVIEGNQRDVDADQLVEEHEDARWPEVIALYCGAAPAASARTMIDNLMDGPESAANVLVESYFAASSKVAHDRELKEGVIRRLATLADTLGDIDLLNRFSATDVAPIANELVGQTQPGHTWNLIAYRWLMAMRDHIDGALHVKSLKDWRSLDLDARARLNALVHYHVGDHEILELVKDASDFYKSEASSHYLCQADIALFALRYRDADIGWDLGCDAALETCLRTLLGTSGDLPWSLGTGLGNLANLPDARGRLRRVDREVLVKLAARLRETRGDDGADRLLNLLTSILNEHEAPGGQSSDESSSPETGGVT